MNSPPRNFFFPVLATCAASVFGLLFWFSGGQRTVFIQVTAPGLSIHRVSLVRALDSGLNNIGETWQKRETDLQADLTIVRKRLSRSENMLAAMVGKEAELAGILGEDVWQSFEPPATEEPLRTIENLVPAATPEEKLAREANELRDRIMENLNSRAQELRIPWKRPRAALSEPEVWLALFRRSAYSVLTGDELYDQCGWATGLIEEYRRLVRPRSVPVLRRIARPEFPGPHTPITADTERKPTSKEEQEMGKVRQQLQELRDELVLKRQEVMRAREDRKRIEVQLSTSLSTAIDQALDFARKQRLETLKPVQPGTTDFSWMPLPGPERLQILVEARAGEEWFWALEDARTEPGDSLRFLPTAFQRLEDRLKQ